MTLIKLTQHASFPLTLASLSSKAKNYWHQQQFFYLHLGVSIWDVES